MTRAKRLRSAFKGGQGRVPRRPMPRVGVVATMRVKGGRGGGIGVVEVEGVGVVIVWFGGVGWGGGEWEWEFIILGKWMVGLLCVFRFL